MRYNLGPALMGHHGLARALGEQTDTHGVFVGHQGYGGRFDDIPVLEYGFFLYLFLT